MADPSTYRPAPGQVPDSPGVYRFRDEHARVIYVGKAKSLRSRLANYFQDLSALHPRTQQMVTTAVSVEWTVVGTEVEALALEYSWIKEFDPRFNVKYRDDKSYPYLAVSMSEEFPRVQVLRGDKRQGTRYFGPFGHAWAIRETVDQLLRVFPVRTCSASVFRRAERSGRPCLLGYLDKCAAPCVGRIDAPAHRAIAEDLCSFMAGDTARFTTRLEAEMRAASTGLEFERAAKLRDDLTALARVSERNAVVLPDGADADIFALHGDELEAAVQVFHVRGGRIRGQRGWVVEKVEDLDDAALVGQLILQVYGGEAGVIVRSSEGARRPERESAAVSAVPKEVLVPALPEDVADLETWLTGLRGSRVSIRVPQRGDKKALSETVLANATQALVLHRTRRASDLTTRSQALQEIADALGLDDAPLRVECYDISTTQGTHQMGSMVVFEDGLPRKSEYRTFAVRGPDGTGAADDTAAIHEVLERRFRTVRTRSEPNGELSSGEVGDDEAEAKARRFAYPPQLIVVDGGPPQVAAAARAMDEAGVTDVALCGLAKRLEEVWLPNTEYPVILRRGSEGLYLLQRLRDEAHRFAINAHRKRRSAAMTVSVLDAIPGLGPTRVAALLDRFGSVRALRRATVDELVQVPGIGPGVAAAVVDALRTGASQPERLSPN